MKPLSKKIVVQICQGTACFVLGAAELQGIEELLPVAWRDIFEFSACPCLELCNDRQNLGRMPYVTIDGVPYADMTREKFFALLEQKINELQNQSKY